MPRTEQSPFLSPGRYIQYMQFARCYKASEWVGGSSQCRRGILVILWMSLVDVAVETYDGPAWRLISTLCGESATRNLARRSGIQVHRLYSVRHLKQYIRNFLKSNARASRTAFLARRSGIQDDIASCIRFLVKMQSARPRTRTPNTHNVRQLSTLGHFSIQLYVC